MILPISVQTLAMDTILREISFKKNKKNKTKKKPQWASVVVYLYMPMEHSSEFCFGLHFGLASKPKYTNTESCPCSKNRPSPREN